MTTQLDIDLARVDSDLVEGSHVLTMEDFRIGVLEEAHRSLSNIAMSLESLVDEKSAMTPAAAEMYGITLESMSGGVYSKNLVSLGGKGSDAVAQTEVSLEALSDKLKEIWDKIVLAVKRALQAVADFMAKLMGGMEKLKVKVDELRARAEGYQSMKLEPKGKMEIKHADRLMLGNTVNRQVIKQGTRLIYEQFYKATDEMTTVMSTYLKQMEVVSGEMNILDPSELEKRLFEMDTEIDGLVVGGFRRIENTELPGGRAIAFDVIKDNRGRNVAVVNVKIVDHPKARNPSGKIEDGVPSADYVLYRLDEVEAFTKAYMSDKRETRVAEFANRKEVTMNKYERSLRQASKSDEQAKRMTKTHRTAANRFQRDYAGTLARLDSYAFRYTRAVVSYLEDCLDALQASAPAT